MMPKSQIWKKIKRNFSTDALFKTIPFFLSCLLTYLLYITENNNLPKLNIEFALLIIIVLFSMTVYFTIFKGHIIPPKQVIQDILATAGLWLGDKYRLNIMELVEVYPIQDSYFKIYYYYNMKPEMSYNGKFKLSTTGVGTAYSDKKPVHINKDEINNEIDPFPKNIWSTPILGIENKTIAVLNIDTKLETIDNETEDNINLLGAKIASIVSNYLLFQ